MTGQLRCDTVPSTLAYDGQQVNPKWSYPDPVMFTPFQGCDLDKPDQGHSLKIVSFGQWKHKIFFQALEAMLVNDLNR